MSNRSMKLIPKSVIRVSRPASPYRPLTEMERRRISNQLNRILAATMETCRWVEQAYWQSAGPAAAKLRSVLVFAHVQLRLQGHMVAERTISLRAVIDAPSTAFARQGGYPEGCLSPKEHAAKIADRLDRLADDIRLAIKDCGRLSDPAPRHVLTGYLDVVHELRWRIEDTASSRAWHGGAVPPPQSDAGD